MDYEAGLAHLELGRRQGIADVDRSTHLAAAVELFDRLEAGQALQIATAVVDDDRPAPAGA
jgi:hypothetical protein